MSTAATWPPFTCFDSGARGTEGKQVGVQCAQSDCTGENPPPVFFLVGARGEVEDKRLPPVLCFLAPPAFKAEAKFSPVSSDHAHWVESLPCGFSLFGSHLSSSSPLALIVKTGGGRNKMNQQLKKDGSWLESSGV